MLLGVFDIGGTSIKYGVINSDGHILFDIAIPTQAYLGGKAVIQTIVSIAKELKENWHIQGISISSAGQIDSVSGVVTYASDNIPYYSGLRVKELIEAQTDLPVKVENDVNCTAIGENWFGAADGVEDFVCITIGTGIGGAIFLNGKLYTGQSYSAGEVGHITLYPNGRNCTCGGSGCFEQYASAKALEEAIFNHFDEKITLPDFFTLVKSGNDKALVCFNQWLDDLTTGLKTLTHLLNPRLIILGGGISSQGDFLLNSIKKSLYPKLMPIHAKNLTIEMAKNGNKANLLGAAKNFFLQ